MVLHLGDEITVPAEGLIMLFNALEMSPELAGLVERYKRERRYSACKGRIKAYALVRERGRDRLYASRISSITLQKRYEDAVNRKSLFAAAVLTTGEE